MGGALPRRCRRSDLRGARPGRLVRRPRGRGDAARDSRRAAALEPPVEAGPRGNGEDAPPLGRAVDTRPPRLRVRDVVRRGARGVLGGAARALARSTCVLHLAQHERGELARSRNGALDDERLRVGRRVGWRPGARARGARLRDPRRARGQSDRAVARARPLRQTRSLPRPLARAWHRPPCACRLRSSFEAMWPRAFCPGLFAFQSPTTGGAMTEMAETRDRATSDPAERGRVLERIKEEGVDFILLWFTDLEGHLKSFAITPSEIEDALDDGMGFDGSSITGLNAIEESDMAAIPDPKTFQRMPYSEGDRSKVARMICDVVTPDGEPYEGDPRYVLRRAVDRMHEMGFHAFNVGP